MKSLIVYASQHGSAARCAQAIQKQLSGDSDIIELRKSTVVDLAPYEQIIVGGSIHAGQVQKRIKRFCERKESDLLSRRLGLYLCCMDEEKAQAQFEAAYPQTLRDHARAAGILGGAFDFDRMNFLERTIVKKVAGVTETVDKIDDEAIRQFVGNLS